jgi:hypothetical protein
MGSVDEDGDFDIVYYNADIINSKSKNSINGNDDPTINFQESRNIPILKNAKKYEFSIIRFQLNGPNKNLPIMIPNIAIGLVDNPTQNLNLTTYTMGISIKKSFNADNGDGGALRTYNGYASLPIIYVPENETYGSLQNGQLPNPPLYFQDVSNDYYYVYSYDHMVGLVNTTFNNLMAKLQADFNDWYPLHYTGIPPSITTKAPYMVYEPATQLFSIYYDAAGFGDTDALNYNGGIPKDGQEGLYFYANNNFYGLFSSFDSDFVITSNLNFDVGANTNEPNIYNAYNKLNTNIWIPNVFPNFPALGASYFKMVENFPNTATLWNPIASIVFTSTQLPIANESVSSPSIFGRSNDVGSTTSANFAPIIGDMAINLKEASGYSNLIFYEPNGEFKMASMMGGSNNSINNIDIQAYWKNRLDNKLYPIRMFNYSSVSMKMMFRKKKI